ncbi:MAG: aldehyde dehydrogenase [Proteobacteria bacterium]|nr:aldehyde dehydrogenase [Pseudomonadota bacterium]
MKEGKHLINGSWVASQDNDTLDVVSPSDGLVFAKIARGKAGDVDLAVKAAQNALDNGAWRKCAAVDRGRLLSKLGTKILDNFDELADLEALDTGKPLKQAKADITAAGRYFEYYGGAADKVHGDTIPFMDGYMVSILREPHGVTGHIIPWNYPAQMYGRSLAPALAMGNAVVLKPAEDACMTSLRMSELAQEVGFPEGAINVVTGVGEEAGASLSAHPGINFLSFTGSPEVGTIVQCAAAKNHVGCVLELGGKSPQIIFDDADIAAALPVIVNAIVQNGGQTCSAGSRLMIQSTVYENYLDQIAEKFNELKVGSHSMDLDCGPLISAVQKNRVEGFLDRARSEGIAVVAQGSMGPGLPSGGFYVTPTLFAGVPRDNELACDEVFGPVLSALSFDDEQDAIKLANSTDYGLVTGVWTKDGARQMRMAKSVRAGQIYINGYGAGGGIELPFGGVKKSGHGREKGFEALYEFCATKTIVFKHD